MIDDSEDAQNKWLTYSVQSAEIKIKFRGDSQSDRVKRVTGVSFKSANDVIERDPTEVTVSWSDNDASNSLTFELDFEEKRWHELYFDLPQMDVYKISFTFRNPDFDAIQLGQIKLFGPSA